MNKYSCQYERNLSIYKERNFNNFLQQFFTMSVHFNSGETESSARTEISLSYLETSLFASVLEDTITELRILGEINNELRIHRARSGMAGLLALKFGVTQPRLDDLAGINPADLGGLQHKLAKLSADRNLALNTMESCYKDLTISKLYTSLSHHVNHTVDLAEYRTRLGDAEVKNRSIRRDLNKQLRQQRNHTKSVIYDTDITIDDLKTQVEDAVLVSECRSRYTDNWQHARTEQHHQSIKDREKAPLVSIEFYKQRADHEQRVHSEVETETLAKVEEWMNRYDKDMEEKDLQIHIKKNDYQNMYEKRLGLRSTIDKHDDLMKKWINFKEEREKARLYRENMTKSAIVVQAWWRGLLVRRALGPYKPAKKKGAKKK